MEIRPERPEEYARVEQIHTLAFGGPQEARVVALVRRSPFYRPELSLVAVVEGEPVGHILFSEVGLQDETGMMRKGVVLAPLAVHPAFQNLGAGKHLVEAGWHGWKPWGRRWCWCGAMPTTTPASVLCPRSN